MTLKALVNGVTEVGGTTSKTFTYEFTLNDPCDPPNSLTVVDTADFDYFIGKVFAEVKTMEAFVIDPNYCLFDVVRSVPDVGVETPSSIAAGATTADPDTLTVDYKKDLTIKDQT